jgi:hypothetical protein
MPPSSGLENEPNKQLNLLEFVALFLAYSTYSSMLKMNTIRIFETSVIFYKTARRDIPENSCLLGLIEFLFCRLAEFQTSVACRLLLAGFLLTP